MSQKKQKNIADHVKPLNMNGLNGRVLDLPAKKKSHNQQILLVYGHHASIERMFGFAEELNRFGAVTLPDLPGFGGMDSFYRIGEEPTLDRMADYLATFVKMRYKNRRITIIGMSYGFLVVARMLQRYPDIAKKVNHLVSIAGFVHHEDFKMKRRHKKALSLLGRFFSYRPTAVFARYALLNGPMIRLAYWAAGESNDKMRGSSLKERRARVLFEIGLWQSNDVRTYCVTGRSMLEANLCHQQKPLDVKVIHVHMGEDRYFDNHIVEQHLGIVFKEVESIASVLAGHAPTVIATAKEAAPYIPKKLRRVLKPKS